MKIQIITSIFIDGQAYDNGDVADVSDKQAEELIGTGRAAAIPADAPVADQSAPAANP